MDVVKSLLPKDSLFVRWLDAWPLAEPPEAYVLFSAMSVFGGCMGRKIWIEQDEHEALYPMLNCLLIGPSGIGKSTSIRMGLKLMDQMSDSLKPQVIKGKSTKEGLHEDLEKNPHSIVVASELANFFSKERYDEGKIPYITQLLDYEPEAHVRTKSGGRRVVTNPSVTIIGGSTVEWLQDQLPATATAGGFLPRFLIVKEDHKSQRVALPKRMLKPAKQRALEIERDRIARDFAFAVSANSGPITFADYAAEDAYSAWYQSYMPETGALAPFAARAGEYVLRMSMILAASANRGAMEAGDVECAIKLHAYSVQKLQQVVVPMSPQGKLIAKVLEIIGSDELSDVQVKRGMRNYCSSQDTIKILESLMQSRDISYVDGKYRRTK